MQNIHKKTIIEHANKIGKLLADSTSGKLSKKTVLKNDQEVFGSLLTLGYLRKQVYPLLDEIRMIIDKYRE